MRSSPVIVVTIAVFLLGRCEQISELSTAGIDLITAGGFLLPMRHIGDIRLKNYLNKSSIAALVAACATAGYSTINDQTTALEITPVLAESQDGCRHKTRSTTKKIKRKCRRHHLQKAPGASGPDAIRILSKV